MRKKIIVILICGLMVVTLAACGSSSKSEEGTEDEQMNSGEEDWDIEEEEAVEEQEEQTEYNSSEDTALLRCFQNLAKQMDLANYEDVIRYVEDTGIEYDSVEPNIDEMGTVTTENDENGCHLFAAVYPNDSGEYTLCSLSYGNRHFEGSVDDNTHVTEPVYKIYNIYNEEPNTEVNSLDDVMAYIRDEMPALIAEDNSREPGEPIDVTLSVTAEVTNEGTVFTVDTNLPDGTRMMVSLDVNGNSRTADATVEGGKASTVAMTDNGSPLKGDFEVRVSMVNAVQQPADVQAVIGVDGENLAGEYLGENTVGDLTISGTFNVSVN